MTAAVLAKVAAPETVTVLANVPADATESACRLVLPPPVGTVRPPAEIVRPPLETVTAPASWLLTQEGPTLCSPSCQVSRMSAQHDADYIYTERGSPAMAEEPDTDRPPLADSSPETATVLAAVVAAAIARVWLLLDPRNVSPCTVRPPERVRLVAVRPPCSSTGAVKLATALTVRRFELLAPMVVLDWATSRPTWVVGELTVRFTLVPAAPIVVAPAVSKDACEGADIELTAGESFVGSLLHLPKARQGHKAAK